ncbi:MAG TPA: CRTAC1 family protein [Pirellulales bacterium]|nr:CRTAC1 family protein [Pirellulales bacterium]
MNHRPSTPLSALALYLPVILLLAVAFVVGRRPWDHGSPASHPGFRDVLPTSGIDFRMEQQPAERRNVNLYDHGCGVAVADYDGDGDDDVLFLKQLGRNGLYRNRGDGTFENATSEAGALALTDRICVGAAFADYDNDGDQDLYVTSTRGGNVLFENQGGGHFLDVTERAGVVLVAHSQTPAFFDYDNDGYLDLFVTNSARWTKDEYDETAQYFPGAGLIWTHVFNLEDREFNVLYRNNRDGTFTNVTDEAGLTGKGWSGDVAVFDFDEDGAIDLLVTNMFGTSQLYHNDGKGHFEDVTRETLGKTSLGAIGSKAFDFNNDGHLDLFITDMHSDMWLGFDDVDLVRVKEKFHSIAGPDGAPDSPQRRYMRTLESRFRDELGLTFDMFLFGNSLFRNDGSGKFTEVSDAAGMETFWPWGICVGDFDNDGYEDAFLPSGMGFPYFYWPNSLMLNNGDGTFTDRATEAGIEPPREGRLLKEKIDGRDAPRSSRCAAAADFDRDGKLDIMVNNFGDQPYYFKNEFADRHYVAFRLRGTRSNRDAVGAVARIYIGDRVMVRQVHSTGGYLSQASKTLHFGLGNQTKVDRLEIRWPSGEMQTIPSPKTDCTNDIVEPESRGP